ncbi:MAG: WecB/TagA/CpsF family glycosyltransferase [Lachnospirales bacterium]
MAKKRVFTKILNVRFDTFSMKDSVDYVYDFLNGEENHIIVTPNPEMVMASRKDEEFERILNSADFCMPDGIGVVWASKFNSKIIDERVGGCDFTMNLFEKISREEKAVKIYILGAAKGVAKKAKINIETKYKNIDVVGTADGYFEEKSEEVVIEEIKTSKPDILLVGLGMKRQEKWISKNIELPSKISMGVGGTIDVLAGEVKRAPDFFIKFHLEWFYRIAKQPKRIGRAMQLPLFAYLVLDEKIFNRRPRG